MVGLVVGMDAGDLDSVVPSGGFHGDGVALLAAQQRLANRALGVDYARRCALGDADGELPLYGAFMFGGRDDKLHHVSQLNGAVAVQRHHLLSLPTC